MSLTYIVEKIANDTLKVGFGADSTNGPKVVDCKKQLDDMIASGELSGGEVMKVNGPASLPVAMTLAHGLGHLYSAVACFDPKEKHYVVAIAHGDRYEVGDVIPA